MVKTEYENAKPENIYPRTTNITWATQNYFVTKNTKFRDTQ